MQKIILIISLITLASCGQKNTVSSSPSNVSTNLMVASPISFVGNYDLIGEGGASCGSNIQIIKGCNGIKIKSYSDEDQDQTEEYCNINNPSLGTTNVTFQGNVITYAPAINTITNFNGDRRERRYGKDGENSIDVRSKKLTRTLTLNTDGTLTRIDNINSNGIRCNYMKR